MRYRDHDYAERRAAENAEDIQTKVRRALLIWQRSAPGREFLIRDGLITIEGPGLARSAFPTTGGELPVGAVFAAIGGAR